MINIFIIQIVINKDRKARKSKELPHVNIYLTTDTILSLRKLITAMLLTKN